MLPKKYRLTRTKDFREVYKRGDSVFSSSLVLRYKRKKQERTAKRSDSRFGIVVSGKVLRTSTARNRLKRQVRAIIYQRIRLKQILPGFDCIITARPKIKGESYQQMEQNLEKLLKKTKIYTSTK